MESDVDDLDGSFTESKRFRHSPQSPALLEEYMAALRRMHLADVRELIATFPTTAIGLVAPALEHIATDAQGGLYWPDPDGTAAWLLPVSVVHPWRPGEIEAGDAVCCGPVVDLLAFNPAAPGCWALRRGNATVLGAIEPQHCKPEKVPIHRDVTRWLRSDCRGLLLLTGDRHEAAAILRRISNIDAEDEAHAAELECDGAATLITVSLDGRVKGYGLQSEREFVLTSGIHRAVASREGHRWWVKWRVGSDVSP